MIYRFKRLIWCLYMITRKAGKLFYLVPFFILYFISCINNLSLE